jgi:DNA polymerase-3 subunit alpha
LEFDAKYRYSRLWGDYYAFGHYELRTVTTAKDSDLYVTQFDNSVAESAGLLKMDFLGLKPNADKDTVKLVKYRTGINLIRCVSIDDKTYELFQRGETVGIFQYESPGMQKYMKDLKPTVLGI